MKRVTLDIMHQLLSGDKFFQDMVVMTRMMITWWQCWWLQQ